jgi:hypothetical protein
MPGGVNAGWFIIAMDHSEVELKRGSGAEATFSLETFKAVLLDMFLLFSHLHSRPTSNFKAPGCRCAAVRFGLGATAQSLPLASRQSYHID